jgi:hypothetical protein
VAKIDSAAKRLARSSRTVKIEAGKDMGIKKSETSE